jgi:tetratricopeptide (TPR) repeat protein
MARILPQIVCYIAMVGASVICSRTATAQQSLVDSARHHLIGGRLLLAANAFRAALRIDSANAPAWNGLGASLNRLEHFDDALVAQDHAVRLDPANAAFRFNRALILAELGRFERALVDLDTALARSPRFVPALTERGAAHAALGNVPRAREDWDRALHLDSTYIWSYYYRGLLEFERGHYAEAASDLARVSAREALPSAHLWSWLAHRRAGLAPPTLPHTIEWPGPILAHVHGEISAARLIDGAQRARLKQDERRLASALFFIAQLQLLDGDRRTATATLNRMLRLEAPSLVEQRVARAELRRLASTR